MKAWSKELLIRGLEENDLGMFDEIALTKLNASGVTS